MIDILIEKHPDGILFIDDMGKIQYLNHSAELLFNKNRNELLNRDFGFPFSESGKTEIQVITGQRKICYAEMKVAAITWEDKELTMVCLRDITDRKEMEFSLKNSLEEKELLIHEVHHRVGNNLQVILCLLSMESEHSDSNSLNRAITHIYAMSLVQKLSYEGNHLNSINLVDYIWQLTDYIYDLMGENTPLQSPVKIEIEYSNIAINSIMAIPIGIILCEILLIMEQKEDYTETNKRFLKISAKEDKKNTILSIESDFIDTDYLKEIQNWNHCGLIEKLLDQIDCTIICEEKTMENKHSRFSINCKKS